MVLAKVRATKIDQNPKNTYDISINLLNKLFTNFKFVWIKMIECYCEIISYSY